MAGKLKGRSSLQVRDFIYLDVERLKSILAQIDEGYLEERATSSATSKTVGGGAEAQVPGLAKLGGTGQYVWNNQATETKTLHDHIYNYVERRLSEESLLYVLNEHLDAERWLSDAARTRVPSTAFAIVTGSALINDYGYLRAFLSDINKVAAALGRLSVQEEVASLPKAKAKELVAAASKKFQLPESQVKDLEVVLKAFVRNNIVVKIMPYEDAPDARVAADLAIPEAFRVTLESLIYRFGSVPTKPWTLFGQIATVPQSLDTPFVYSGTLGAALDSTFQGMFDALRSFEPLVGSAVYPEIAMTPIALYRS
jgi:hypothetical protein